VLFCTPTYALHLVEVAEQCKFNLARSAVEKIVVAGEPGGSIPSIRQRIENAWQAQLFDHAGASEVGPWGYADAARRGLHVMESEFIAEFISVETGEPAASGELSHLVLTTLGRVGMPVIRYRTGDLVRPVWHEDALEKGTGTLWPEGGAKVRADEPRASPLFQRGANWFVLLEGGVLGRADDMMIIRGVNVFPTAVEQILHSFPEVVEYRMTARKSGAMDELEVEVEDHLADPRRIAEELYLRLGLRIEVRLAPLASLPRFEGKGRRFVDLRYPIEA
jgi:phenylacetate-CoA ligase